MVWLDEADLHAAGRLPSALDEAQTPLELMQSALEQLGQLVPSELAGWDRSRGRATRPARARSRVGSEVSDSVAARPERRGDEAVVFSLGRQDRRFSERDRDVLDVARPGLEHALHTADARGRLLLALASNPPPGTAVVLLDD